MSTTVNWWAQHDPDARTMYVYLPGHPNTFRCVGRTDEVGHGLNLDFDHAGRLIGIELLHGTGAEPATPSPDTGETR